MVKLKNNDCSSSSIFFFKLRIYPYQKTGFFPYPDINVSFNFAPIRKTQPYENTIAFRYIPNHGYLFLYAVVFLLRRSGFYASII